MDLLVRCDAMILCDGWEDSKGCLNEINEAEIRQIPVFYNINDLESWLR